LTWTPAYLEANLPAVQAKIRAFNEGNNGAPPHVFHYFNKDTPWATTMAGRGEDLYWEGILPSKEFFRRLAQASADVGQSEGRQGGERQGEKPPGEYLYASGPVEEVLHPQLLQQLGDPGVLNPGIAFARNVWIGSADVTAGTHYDTSHNLFVPLYGTKRFMLQPPAAHAQLRLYPSLHPHHRQAQVQRVEPARTRPLHEQEIDVRAGRGEALFIPAHWFHSVRSLGTSIATNVWWPSADSGLFFDEILALPVPFDEAWPPAKTALALQVFVGQLLAELLSQPDVMQFCRRLFKARFSLLPQDLLDGFSFGGVEKYTCSATAAQVWYVPAGSKVGNVDSSDIVLLAETMTTKTLAIAAAFGRLSAPAIRDIYLGTYIEQVCAVVVGASSAALFIRDCL